MITPMRQARAPENRRALDRSGGRWKDGPTDDRRHQVTEASTASRMPTGAILAIVGGVLLVIGSFLSWAEFSGADQSEVLARETAAASEPGPIV